MAGLKKAMSLGLKLGKNIMKKSKGIKNFQKIELYKFFRAGNSKAYLSDIKENIGLFELTCASGLAGYGVARSVIADQNGDKDKHIDYFNKSFSSFGLGMIGLLTAGPIGAIIGSIAGYAANIDFHVDESNKKVAIKA